MTISTEESAVVTFMLAMKRADGDPRQARQILRLQLRASHERYARAMDLDLALVEIAAMAGAKRKRSA